MEELIIERTATDNGGFILVKRETVGEMVKRSCRLAKMVILLTHICELKKVEMTLSAEEVCDVLEIEPRTLERCKEKRWIKYIFSNGTYIFKAYDIAILAERINRRKVLSALSKIPTVAERPNKQDFEHPGALSKIHLVSASQAK